MWFINWAKIRLPLLGGWPNTAPVARLQFRDGGLVDDAPPSAAPRAHPPRRRLAAFSYVAVENLTFLLHDDGACSLINPSSHRAHRSDDIDSVLGRVDNSSCVCVCVVYS